MTNSDSLIRRSKKIWIAVLLGVISAFLCWELRHIHFPGPGDFLWPLRAARDLVAGRDPYNYPTSNLAVPYPLPAAFFGLPFVGFDDPVPPAIFFGISTTLLAYGLLRSGPAWRLLLLLSPCYVHSMVYAQWPPLVMSMAFFPALLFLVLVKPQIAVPMALSGYVRWTWRGIIVTLIVGAVSLLIMPTWPIRFLSQLGPYEGVMPILMISGGGPLLLLSLLRWREKNARLLLLMSLMPQRMFYDQLLLWFIPRSVLEICIVTLASWGGALFGLRLVGNWQNWIVISMYLPSLVLVLWHGRSRVTPRRGALRVSASNLSG